MATLGRLVPQLRGQEFTEDERETVHRSQKHLISPACRSILVTQFG
ncbi:hypothetical protein ABZT04_42985 [Streptomyces sp. NPDC005492]